VDDAHSLPELFQDITAAETAHSGKVPDRRSRQLKAVGDADTYVVIVLTASPGINVQVGSSGVEIARFEPRAPTNATATHPVQLRTGLRRYCCRWAQGSIRSK